MKLLLQHNAWSCLPTAFAIALDVEPKDILEFCGHDGSEIVWHDMPEPKNRRAFGVHEMIDFCITQLVYPVEIYSDIAYGHLDSESGFYRPENAEARLEHYMMVCPGVLLGCNPDGKPHAVAWCHKEQMILDPDGCKYTKDKFQIDSFIAFF